MLERLGKIKPPAGEGTGRSSQNLLSSVYYARKLGQGFGRPATGQFTESLAPLKGHPREPVSRDDEPTALISPRSRKILAASQNLASTARDGPRRLAAQVIMMKVIDGQSWKFTY